MAPDEKDVWGRWAAPGEPSSGEERPFTVTDYSNTPRDSTRVPLAHRIQLKFDRFSGFIDEYISNLSPGGIFIRTDTPEDPGQLLEFEFRLGDGFELIRGRGEVVWARQAAEGADRPSGMGVRFLDLSPGSKDLIYKIVDDFVAHGGKPFDLTASAASPPDLSNDATMPLTAAVLAPGLGRPSRSEPQPPGQQAPGLPPPRQGKTALPPLRQASPAPPLRQASPAPPPRPSDDPSLPWSLDLPAILPVPGVPAITPRSPLEFLVAPPAGAPVLSEPDGDAMAPAVPPAAAGAAAPAGPSAPSAPSDHSPAESAAAGGLAPPPVAGKPAMDPLEQMLASLPPLDDLAPLPPASPAPRAPLTSALPPFPTAAAPTAPALPFSAFDLNAPRRRSRLPLMGAVLAVALLGAAVYLLRDTVMGWINRGDSAAAPAVAPRRAAPRPLQALAVAGPLAPATAQPPGSPAAGSSVSDAGAPSPPPGALAFSPPAAVAAPGSPAPGGSAARTVTAGTASRADRSIGNGSSQAAPSLAPAGAAGPVAATPAAADARGSGGMAAAAPPPLVSASNAAAAPGARLSALERITWEATRGGTDVVLWGNGDFTPQSYTRSRVGGIAGLPAREVVRLVGITRPFPQSKLAVATSEISQIRIGSHPHDELHVVIDLTGHDVKVAGVEVAPHQLRLHLAAH
jgi:molecular chaperone DnaK